MYTLNILIFKLMKEYNTVSVQTFYETVYLHLIIFFCVHYNAHATE